MREHHRFFFHYNKPNNMMTVHYRGKCYIVKDIVCKPQVVTKWNKKQPRIVLQGWTKGVFIKNEKGNKIAVIT